MEENNRKGPGIFYAVTGVATLVVAIIGATFAFFSANATASIPQGTTAEAGGVELTVKEITNSNSNLVPLNLRPNDTKDVDVKDQFGPAMAAKCIDENGNNVCVVYRIIVKNKSTQSTISVRGHLTLTSTAKNVYWRLISATESSDTMTGGSKVDYSTDILATSTGGKGFLTVGGNSVSQTGVQGSGPEVASHTLEATQSATYYVVIWLEELGKPQEDDDAKKNFSGTVFFSAVDAAGNDTGITASFTQS